MNSKKIVLTVLLLALMAFVVVGCGQGAEEPKDTGKEKEDATPAAAEVATYVGSDACKTCHSEVYKTFSETLHPSMIQDAKADPSVIKADFTKENEPLAIAGVKKEDIVYTIGSKYKQRYVIQEGEALRILPTEYKYADGKWYDYHAEDWKERDYQAKCTACHATGVNPETEKWTEPGIGCEACHGPASLHISNGGAKDKIVNIANLDANLQIDVCAQCHIRGKNTKFEGREDALGFLPGMKLSDVYKWATPETDDPEKPIFHEDGASKKHHQQLQDYEQSKHYGANITCTTCHDPHKNVAEGQLKDTVDNVCLSCHNEGGKATTKLDTPVKDNLDKYMPERAKSGAAPDIRTHTFKLNQPK